MQSNFCPNCGQKDGLSPRSIGAAFSEVLGNVFSYDNKAWRSLVLLCFKPGKLTKAYCQGKRSLYFDPLRLFLFMSALVFLAPDTIHLGEYQVSEEWSVPVAEVTTFRERLAVGAERAMELQQEDPEEYISFLNHVTKRYLAFDFIIGIVCFTLFMRLVHWRSFLVEHFVFALHFGSLIMVANLLLRLVLPDVGFTIIEAVFMMVVQLVYFQWAYMVVYSKPGKKNRSFAFVLGLVALAIYMVPYIAAAQLTGYYTLMPPAA